MKMSLISFICVAYLVLIFASCGQCSLYYEQFRASAVCAEKGYFGICVEPLVDGKYPSICRTVRCAKSPMPDGSYEPINMGPPKKFTGCGRNHICVDGKCKPISKQNMIQTPDVVPKYNCKHVQRT